MRIASILLLIPGLVIAQQTRHEITKPASNPADDKKDVTGAVPEVYAVDANFQRVVVLRFKYKTDLLAGLERMVAEHKIRNGVILSAFGSVRGYHIHQVSNREFPSKDMMVKDPTAPADIIAMGGFIMNGRVHPHITLSNPERAFGGHLEPGTTVFTFAVVTIGVLDDKLDLSKLDDKTYR